MPQVNPVSVFASWLWKLPEPSPSGRTSVIGSPTCSLLAPGPPLFPRWDSGRGQDTSWARTPSWSWSWLVSLYCWLQCFWVAWWPCGSSTTEVGGPTPVISPLSLGALEAEGAAKVLPGWGQPSPSCSPSSQPFCCHGPSQSICLSQTDRLSPTPLPHPPTPCPLPQTHRTALASQRPAFEWLEKSWSPWTVG